jgi:aspartyl-tRNA(Asn)/glutamyl-tRNA(Gln) amidotransferase subunit B
MDADDSATAAKQVANWMTGELAAALNRNEIDIVNSPIGPVALAGLLKRNADNTLNNKMTKEVFAAMWAGEGDADSIIAAKGLKQISDSGEIEKIVDQVLAANAQQVADYKSGKEKAFNSLVGQVMKASKGKANPAQVNALLKQKLGAR